MADDGYQCLQILLQSARREIRADQSAVWQFSESCERRWLQNCAHCKIQRYPWSLYVARPFLVPGNANGKFCPVTTAVFSTCGMHILTFALAAFLSLPKQFVTVYIGVIIKESGLGTLSYILLNTSATYVSFSVY